MSSREDVRDGKDELNASHLAKLWAELLELRQKVQLAEDRNKRGKQKPADS